MSVEQEARERLATQLERYASSYDKLHRDIAADFRQAAEIVRASRPSPSGEMVERIARIICEKSGCIHSCPSVGCKDGCATTAEELMNEYGEAAREIAALTSTGSGTGGGDAEK